MKSDADEYLTKDIFLASLLFSSNIKLIGLKEEGNFYWFIFQGKDKAECLSDRFWQREATVNARVFVDCFRTLRDMIFARKHKK